jgi:hypothetical protein
LLVVKGRYLEEMSEDVELDDKLHRHRERSHLMSEYHQAIHILASIPVEVSLGLFSLLCTWSLLSLTCFHALLISLAQTTNERVRGVYQYGGVENPDDLGCLRNWKQVLCSSVEKSLLPSDFSEVATIPQKEESVWVGWKENESFVSLIPPGVGASSNGNH